jgi:raffinose/stachyose/melibiose transport system permease protein
MEDSMAVSKTGNRAIPIKRSLKAALGENLTGYTMILPAMFFFVLFLVIPIFKAMQVSLYDYAGVGVMKDFIGFENYVKSITDKELFFTMLNTFKLAGFDLLFSIGIGFFLAYVLFKRINGWKFFTVSLYIPAIVTIVVSGIIWRQIYEANQGLLNSLLQTFGLGTLKGLWLSDMDNAMKYVIVAWIWKSIPFCMLLLYSSMLSIPDEMFEAAEIDGGTEWDKIRYIVFPFMMPVISILAVLTIANDFRAFDMIQVLTGGGPASATQIATLYVYKLSISLSEYGYANAIAVEIFFIVGLLVYLLLGILRKFGLNGNDQV